MKSEDLIALAAARGIDLLQAARIAAKPTTGNGGVITKWVNGVKSEVLVEHTGNRARGSPTHSSIRPNWTLAELGVCARSVPDVCFWAACYAYAGDHSKYWKLHGALLDRATVLRINRRWPLEVVDHHGIKRPYLAHLATLVLDYEANRPFFNACPDLFWIYLGVTEKTWEQVLMERYRAVEAIWDGWCQTASGMIQAKLRNPESAGSA